VLRELMVLTRAVHSMGVVRDELTWLSDLMPTPLTEQGLSPSFPRAGAVHVRRRDSAARAGPGARPAPWTTNELAKWLDEPLPPQLPDVRSLVTHHPLWSN
jgi:hypothetical protein